ncbi:DNA-J related domain-containing protein [Salinispira pacifica]|uniref:DnaJ-related protein n=1 Tax=Salinispira pacifica TaxID=1307761 RepID=V5WKM8_9SPIO|nr:DNA-J related domain-containing protein [Salinispira pacifica]AHC16200.1 DnaJ-related protein [Salinispira pacifica]
MKIAGTSAEAALLADQILPHLEEILKNYPEGITEYQLLKLLQERFAGVFNSAESEPLEIYHSHFFLFHCLYHLQRQLWRSGQDLNIFCLDIRIVNYQPAAESGKRPVPDHTTEKPAEQSLDPADPLREYYLDWSNYEEADEESVAGMLRTASRLLNAYWQKDEAMETLGLTEPLNRDELNRRFRELSKKYHPDAGADGVNPPPADHSGAGTGRRPGPSARERNSEKFRKITQAAHTLRRILDISPGTESPREFR